MRMDISVSFPGGKRVDADLGHRTIQSDQSPAHGGEGSAPEPFELFLASLATCAGIYVLGFCQAREIPTEGIKIVQRATYDEAGKALVEIALDVHLPAAFPEKYRSAVVAAASNCKVKKVLMAPPRFDVKAVIADEASSAA
jgi:putative redox protein